MRMRMYQLRDLVACCVVGPVIVERNDGPAVRSFYKALEDEKSGIGAFPRDYELVCLCEYDDSTGEVLEARDAQEHFPSVVARGVEWESARRAKEGE